MNAQIEIKNRRKDFSRLQTKHGIFSRLNPKLTSLWVYLPQTSNERSDRIEEQEEGLFKTANQAWAFQLSQPKINLIMSLFAPDLKWMPPLAQIEIKRRKDWVNFTKAASQAFATIPVS